MRAYFFTQANVVLMNQLLAQVAHSRVAVPLNRGLVAYVDAIDADRVLSRRWFAVDGGRAVYAHSAAQRDGSPATSLHLFIMRPEPGLVVDHIDGDGLNNTRVNLRICTHKQNIRNQRAQLGRASRYKGVIRQRNRWQACIKHDGETIHLGTFDEEERAARQYDRAARLLFGQFARTNEMLGLLEPRTR